MDKFVFLQELSTISKDSDRNSQNFEMMMNFSEPVDLFYSTILEIKKSTGGKATIHIEPMDFSQCIVPPGDFAFNINGANLDNLEFAFGNGFVTVCQESTDRFITKISLYRGA